MIYKLPVKRPIAICALFAVLFLGGYVSFLRLPIALMPDVAMPRLTVLTEFEGASPQDVETLVTGRLEDTLGIISGLERIYSVSKENQSTIELYFQPETDMSLAAVEVREQIDLVEDTLPDDVSTPVIQDVTPGDFPITNIALSGTGSLHELREYADRLEMEISRVGGVAEVELHGLPEREILVEVDRSQLLGYNVSLLQITEALSEANATFRLGDLDERDEILLVRGLGQFRSYDDIGRVAIETDEENKIFLDQIATINPFSEGDEVIARHGGDRAVVFDVHMQDDANLMQVTSDLRERLNYFEDIYLSDEVDLQMLNEQEEFIGMAIDNVGQAVLLGSLFAFLVILLFLGDLRDSLIICTAIPISVFCTFLLLYVFDLSLNIMSLSAIALGVGMLIDNSIVVLENINRHYYDLEIDKTFEAAIADGVSEVSGAITASTLTTVAVFFPIAFMVTFISRFFAIMALVIAFSLFTSLFVALFLIPALTYLFYQLTDLLSRSKVFSSQNNFFSRWAGGTFQLFRYAVAFPYHLLRQSVSFIARRVNKSVDKMARQVKTLIIKCWDYKLLISSVTLLLLALLGIGVYLVTPVQLFPRIDSSNFILTLDFPPGSPHERVDANIPEIDNIMRTIGYVDDFLVVTGERLPGDVDFDPTKIVIQGSMVPLVDRERNIDELLLELSEKFEERFPVSTSYRLAFGDFTEELVVLPRPVEVKLQGYSYEVLEDLSEEIQSRLLERENLYNVQTDLDAYRTEYSVDIDKREVALYGLSVVDVARSANIALDGHVPTDFTGGEDGGSEIGIRVRLDRPPQTPLSYVERIPLKSGFGGMLDLSEVVEIREDETITNIRHEDGLRTVTVSADIDSDDPHGIFEDISASLADFPLPADFYLQVEGLTEEILELQHEVMLTVLFAILLVYMTMAGQFNSLLSPFVVMFSVPMAFVGGFIFLFLGGQDISIVSGMGFIVLAGIIVNNAILIVDLIGQYRSEMSLKEATYRAAEVRVRPVLMTAFTTMLALLPLLFLRGEASALQRPLVLAIFGGLLFGTFLTLVYIPLLYGVFYAPLEAND